MERRQREPVDRTRVTTWVLTLPSSGNARSRKTEPSACSCLARAGRRLALYAAALSASFGLLSAVAAAQPGSWSRHPSRTSQAGQSLDADTSLNFTSHDAFASEAVRPQPASSNTASLVPWQPLGPAAVNTASYGLVTGRITSIAFDPADPTGNRVYLGTTGGGVWLSQNAATADLADIQFVPLTDAVGALTQEEDPSISIGAITVQPGGTGVVLAGTGDPNDSPDSYYGTGLLRSTDGGNSWSLIEGVPHGPWSFLGEAFAGFAWSTVNPQLVVGAVSQSLDSVLTGAWYHNASYQGLYYSTDSGATWSLARITDPGGFDVQGPLFLFAQPDGNAATSVVWNPIRKLFIAAVRAHGYYQSADGVTWTRLSAQPGTGLTTANCPTNAGTTGSRFCPIFRGTLAVNPTTGDTFAWTTDIYNQDQGIWQDQCGLVAGACTNQNVTFGKRINTAALDVNDPHRGPATIEEGDYTLALAAVPSGQDTLLLAGADDLWRCSLNAGCAWRNTTNAYTCKSARVAAYQHALAWSSTNPLEILIANDGGLWRSLDAVGETGAACDAGDANHFQNLNSAIGSLAETQSLSSVGSPLEVTVGLGVIGTAGTADASGAPADWPQVLDGFGGPVAIDSTNPSNWYVNNLGGVSIHRCVHGAECEPADFGLPTITYANVGGDGIAMNSPAPFLVDPLDPSQLLIGTCRVWRGPANGSGWTSANAVSPILDGSKSQNACNGDPYIRSMAAMPLGDGSEILYVGMYGVLDGGGVLAGHVLSAKYSPTSSPTPVWTDLTANPVTNFTEGLNPDGLDISSIVIDPHDATGHTIYVTVKGIAQSSSYLRVIYRSTDGGASWKAIMSNLPRSAANALAVDPQDAATVYLALDAGLFSTRRINDCSIVAKACWSAYGSGLPQSPVTQLAVAGDKLVAGTYGRGVWQIPLWTAGTQPTSAGVSPTSLSFPTQPYNTTSSAKTITLTNTGAAALTISSIATSGDFDESDNCQTGAIAPGGSCAIQATFSPAQSGPRTGQLTISANVSGGQITVDLNGIGAAPTGVTLNPSGLNFGSVSVGKTSAALPVTAENATSSGISITSLTVTPPFVLSANSCGTSLTANSDCQLLIEFAPSQSGDATGTLTMVDGAGTQTVSLSGSGAAPATDALSLSSLTFSGTVVGLISPPQTVSMINSGGVPLTSIAASVTGPFQVSNNCTAQLGANSTCVFSVVYEPTANGAQTGVLTISDVLRVQTVGLTGLGLQPAQISASPTSLTFATQNIATASSPMTLTLTNTGGAPMANVGFQINGLSASSFAIGPSTCGSILTSGASCTLQIIFEPSAAGGAVATLTVSSATLGVKPVQIALSGTCRAPAGINVNPPQMTLTAPALGQVSSAQTVTISNSSTQAAEALTLSFDAPFSLSQNSCDATLAAGASCSADVSFTPNANGLAFGVLTVESSLNAANVILSGLGGAAGSLQMQPSLLTFATTGVGVTSSSQTITLTNPGPVDLPALTLTASSGFQLTNSTCTATLTVSASCTASVAFSPTSAGQQTGSLTATSSAMASPVQAVLSGMGFDFTVTVLGASAQTVSSGQTASFTLVLTPANGSSGTFTFQCGSLPASAVCTFNPSNDTVAGGTTGNVMVQITTGHTARSTQPLVASGAPMALCALALLPVALRIRRKEFWLSVLLLVSVCGLVSCAGSGGGTGGTIANGQSGSSATAGTYSIPVDVAANGVSHSVTLTLTVD